MELALSGDGNTALWPAPVFAWPASVRAYADRVDERVTSTDGLVGGMKTFRYLAVPDSAGAMVLPAVGYQYFDLAANRYLGVSLPAASVPVARGGELAASTALPPPLLDGDAAPLDWRLAHGVPDWVWLLVLVLPPAAARAAAGGSPFPPAARARRRAGPISRRRRRSSRRWSARWCPIPTAGAAPASRRPCAPRAPTPSWRAASPPRASGCWRGATVPPPGWPAIPRLPGR